MRSIAIGLSDLVCSQRLWVQIALFDKRVFLAQRSCIDNVGSIVALVQIRIMAMLLLSFTSVSHVFSTLLR
jgi:hypothetical protein